MATARQRNVTDSNIAKKEKDDEDKERRRESALEKRWSVRRICSVKDCKAQEVFAGATRCDNHFDEDLVMKERPTNWEGCDSVGYTRCIATVGAIVNGNIENGVQCMNVAEEGGHICENETCMNWLDVEYAMKEGLYNEDDDTIEDPLE
jgi:hypothetical protein